MSLAEIDNFGDQKVVFADHDVDWFEVQVSDIVTCYMSHPIDDINQQTKFGKQGDCFLSAGNEVVHLVTCDIFHHKDICPL